MTELGTANMLLGLTLQRQHWLMLRRGAIELGMTESVKAADEHLKSIELATEELKRTKAEMGWGT